MSEWPHMVWYKDHVGQKAWFVCRNGHLWLAEVPAPWMFYERDQRDPRPVQLIIDKVSKVKKCGLCQVLKAGSAHVRGLTMVCPDFGGVIKARELLDGTIEHHEPDAVAKAYSVEGVNSWKSVMAMAYLQYSMAERQLKKAFPRGRR